MPKVTIKAAGNVKLSPNFWLSDFAHSELAERMGIDNHPDPHAIANLYRLAKLMEKVRAALGDAPISVLSAYRSVALNELLNGEPDSPLLLGEGVNFRCPSRGSPLDICRAIVRSRIKFGTLTLEGKWACITLPSGNPELDGRVLTRSFVRDADGQVSVTETEGLPQ